MRRKPLPEKMDDFVKFTSKVSDEYHDRSTAYTQYLDVSDRMFLFTQFLGLINDGVEGDQALLIVFKLSGIDHKICEHELTKLKVLCDCMLSTTIPANPMPGQAGMA